MRGKQELLILTCLQVEPSWLTVAGFAKSAPGISWFFTISFVCVCVCVCLSPPSVHKPEKVCWAEAAGTVRDGLRAYTALHYLSQVSPGTSVLVLDGASVGNSWAIITHSLCANNSLSTRPLHFSQRDSPGLLWDCWQGPSFHGFAGKALPREILSQEYCPAWRVGGAEREGDPVFYSGTVLPWVLRDDCRKMPYFSVLSQLCFLPFLGYK